MNLIQRVKDILLKPKDAWPVIASEAASTGSIYRDYLVYIAAIPALAAFIGLSIIGVGGFGFGFRVPFFTGLVNMVVTYGLTLVAVYLVSLIVNALAPTFGGSKDPLSALKLMAYASTASLVGGVFALLPMLSILGLLASLYGIYLVYTGLPVLMKCPPEKAVPYTAVVMLCGIVAMFALGSLTAMVGPGPHRMGMGGDAGGGAVSIKTPGGEEVTIDTKKMEDMARKMEEASKRMEQAQKSGDGAAAGKAMGDILGAMQGGGGAPLPAQDLKALLPESIGSMKRTAFEASSGQAVGLGGSSAKGNYGSGDQQVELAITDMGGFAGLAALAGWANMTVDRETDTQVEKVYKDGKRTVREDYRKDGSRGEVTVVLANGVLVEAKGRGLPAAELKKIAESVDLGKLEAMKRAEK